MKWLNERMSMKSLGKNQAVEEKINFSDRQNVQAVVCQWIMLGYDAHVLFSLLPTNNATACAGRSLGCADKKE